jgi:ComB9 competence protein
VRTMNNKALLAILLGSVMASPGFAQVPPTTAQRPGLNFDTAPPVRPATTLVQRDFQTNPGQVPQQVIAQPPAEEFFYIDEGSQAPDQFTDGLSDFNESRMVQAGEQLRGNYGSVQQNGMPSGMTQDAWSRPFDHMSEGQSAPGNIRYQWTADMVMPVRLRAGMVTNVVLPEWEAVQDVMIGDGAAVEGKIMRPNMVSVRSLQVGLDTSLTVIGGSGNVYTFYLRTEGRNTRIVTDLQVFVQASPAKGSGGWFSGDKQNVYKSNEGSSGSGDNISVGAAASQGDEPVPSERRIFNLKMYEVNKGDRIIAPEYTYTDGRFTYLHYAAGVTDRPAVFRIVDGVEGRVNTRVTGRHSEVIIVEAVGDFILRSGSRAVCIKVVNENDIVASTIN